jgi:hypothetical protein
MDTIIHANDSVKSFSIIEFNRQNNEQTKDIILSVFILQIYEKLS